MTRHTLPKALRDATKSGRFDRAADCRADPTFDHAASREAKRDLARRTRAKRMEANRTHYIVHVWTGDSYQDATEGDYDRDGLTTAAAYIARNRLDHAPIICRRIERTIYGVETITDCAADLADLVRSDCTDNGLTFPEWCDVGGIYSRDRASAFEHPNAP